MKAPHLSRKLVLEERARSEDGAGGSVNAGWVSLGTLWADVVARSGREAVSAAREQAQVSYRITVRSAPYGAPSRPRPDHRFREGARVFHIIAVTEADPAGHYLTCYAEEGGVE